MKAKIFKCMVLVVFILTIGLHHVEDVGAQNINVIDIPMVGSNYNNLTGQFFISGRPASTVKVFYEDGNVGSYNNVRFDLDTYNLVSLISPDYLTATYTLDSAGLGGTVELIDKDNPNVDLLIGRLVNLELKIIDPNLGAFKGTGYFDVTDGTLYNDFGGLGGLATIGISWNVPASFETPFAAMTNTKLYPYPPISVPDEPNMLLLWSLSLGGGGLVAGFLRLRKKKQS